MLPANLTAATAASTAAMNTPVPVGPRLTPTQAATLIRALRMAAQGQNCIDFAASPTIKRLLALGLIEFSPTGHGAGHITLTPTGRTWALASIATGRTAA